MKIKTAKKEDFSQFKEIREEFVSKKKGLLRANVQAFEIDGHLK